MTTHNYNNSLRTQPRPYHRPGRGGNKQLANMDWSIMTNDDWQGKAITIKSHINKSNHSIMAKSIKEAVDSYIQDSRVVRVLALRALRSHLVNCDGRAAGVQLFEGFCGFSHLLTIVALTPNEIEEGAKVVSEYSLTDKSGKSICRSSWGVSPRGISGTLVSSSFSTWFSGLRAAYNMEGDGGKLHTQYSACGAVLTYAKGGRTAATDEQKQQKRVNKAVGGASASAILAALSDEQKAALAALLGK